MSDRESKRGRGDLWATQSGRILHAQADCCPPGSRWPRRKVKDHSYPDHFDADAFVLCPRAVAADPPAAVSPDPIGESRDG